MTTTLYHINPSFYSQIARLALIEKGVSWQARVINIGPMMENYAPWYIKLNPRGVVPTLDHDGHIVTDAFRIIDYIDEHFEGPALKPETPEALAEMEDWLATLNAYPTREFSYSSRLGGLKGRFLSALMNVSYIRRRQVLRKWKARYPDLADAYEYRLKDIDTWQKRSNDPKEAAALLQEYIDLLDRLERALETRQPWVLGEQYTLVDVVWTVFLARLITFHRDDLLSPEQRPHVAAYFARVQARPSFAKAEIWLQIRPKEMASMLAPFVLPRLGIATLILTIVVWAACYT